MSVVVEWGSSPLTRGKPPGRQAQCRDERLIPAHAGKTCVLRFAHVRPPAHPRSRGENCSMCPGPSRSRGSSPLTRGKLQRRTARVGSRGLIPAHAGKTWSRPGGSNGRRAHPRSRGENRGAGGGDKVGTGSSPLTRGKRSLMPTTLSWPGLIPAHAGKTRDERARLRWASAHPRSRGENDLFS